MDECNHCVPAVLPKEMDHKQVIKWVTVLFLAKCIGMVNLLVSFLPGAHPLTTWIGRCITACAILSFAMLARRNANYGKAALLQGISVAGSLISSVFGSLMITAAMSIFGIAGSYMEFQAHSGLVVSMDRKLSGRWSSLFVWELVVGLITGVLSTFCTVIAVISGLEMERTTAVVMALPSIVSVGLQSLYLVYLRRTLTLLKK